ncbi:uncharacterized protein LOC131614547 [Vicia villosa]|uniref:uncharacterized protein LOC131614547 n=1 Tax=Vicia villosa TaxID=3911 RepID=UPI00273AE872|nr:uncharacterized protein LOC131614547 [Vicia villosa]
MEILNVALLSKWKWRILMDKEAVWRDILEERYGNIKLKVLVGDLSVVKKKDSIWWRDLLTSDNFENLLLDNFSSAIQVKVSNGDSTPLWYADWFGKHSLMKGFPSLFAMADNHLQAISSAGAHIQDCWKWNFISLFESGSKAYETAAVFFCSGLDFAVSISAGTGAVLRAVQEMEGSSRAAADDDSSKVQRTLLDFCATLNSNPLLKEEDDTFIWRLNLKGCFSVNSCYVFFKGKLSSPLMNIDKAGALANIWNIKVPSKILFFCWRFIHNRIATKDNLVSRGILNEEGDSFCVLCDSEEETLMHLFSECEMTLSIWRRVFMWLGVGEFLSFEEFLEFFYNCAKIGCPSKRAMVAVVWLATIWTVWLKRNAIIFRDEFFSFIESMSKIVFVSWSWLNSFYKKLPLCNFYGWNIQPLLCFVV